MTKEEERISKSIETELNFMKGLFFMAREEGLTNDPAVLFKMYR
jgi:hypothetical protein